MPASFKELAVCEASRAGKTAQFRAVLWVLTAESRSKSTVELFGLTGDRTLVEGCAVMRVNCQVLSIRLFGAAQLHFGYRQQNLT